MKLNDLKKNLWSNFNPQKSFQYQKLSLKKLGDKVIIYKSFCCGHSMCLVFRSFINHNGNFIKLFSTEPILNRTFFRKVFLLDEFCIVNMKTCECFQLKLADDPNPRRPPCEPWQFRSEEASEDIDLLIRFLLLPYIS